MENINSFYSSILNLRNTTDKSTITDIVTEQKKTLEDGVPDLAGFCRVIASNIEDELKKNGVVSYKVDLNDILGVDHTILIAEYKDNGIIKRILIDPTFIQFKAKENSTLRYLSMWPSEKIKDKSLVASLLTDGYADIDDIRFSDYLSGFSKEDISVNLDEFLLRVRLSSLENGTDYDLTR